MQGSAPGHLAEARSTAAAAMHRPRRQSRLARRTMLSVALLKCSRARWRSRRAQANSVARMPRPAGMTRIAGPGSTTMAIPTNTTVDPTTRTTSRQSGRSAARRAPFWRGESSLFGAGCTVDSSRMPRGAPTCHPYQPVHRSSRSSPATLSPDPSSTPVESERSWRASQAPRSCWGDPARASRGRPVAR